MAAKKTKASGRRVVRSSKPKSEPLPPRIYAIASPHSVGGVSLFEAQGQITADTVMNFFSEEEVMDRAVGRLQDAGFEVLQVTQTTIHIAGSKKTYLDAFNTQLYTEERPVIKPGGVHTTGTFIDTRETELSGLISTQGTRFADLLEGVAIEEPRYYMAANAFAPTKSYWHLDVPAGVSLGCNADRAHRSAITGKGIKVAMCDSGQFAHPFFTARGYRVSATTLAPGTSNPADDPVGHGTGESANIFAVAPDVQLLPVKMNFANTTAAFNTAVGLGPHIITCSWGSSIQNGPLSAADQALAAAIATAVASGIIVVFSAGNGHYGFPGQHPDVISAGGAFMKIDGTFTASDYASGFISNVYPNRRAPDLCGLVGMKPKAIYIMLPLQPGDQIDVGNAGGTFPGPANGGAGGDETTNNDGWAAFSGTSAAAPQLAGAAALVKQACPSLTPAQVRAILTSTARDVKTGNCNTACGGAPATVGPDTATGFGLVDAEKAVLKAKLQCGIIGPILPIQPIQPIVATPRAAEATPQSVPVGPVRPVRPVQPIVPIQPIRPVRPIRPIVPIVPIGPIRPVRPIRPIDPGPLASASAPQLAAESGGRTGQRFSEEELKSLEEMASRGEIGLDDLES